MDTVLLGIAAVLFVGAIAYAIISYVRGGKDDVGHRLERYTEDLVAEEVVEAPVATRKKPSVLASRLDKALEGRGFTENLRSQLAQANLKLTAGEFLAATIIVVVLFAAVSYLLRRSAVISLAAGVGGFFAPRIYVSRAQKKRLTAFNDQLGDTINLMVNSIRSGYSVLQAMEAVSHEMAPPIGEEFDRVVKEVQFGVSMEVALDNMMRRVPSDDLDLMITAIKVQREVGGNLAEVLDSISFTIRERVRIKGEIQALTAMGRGSGTMISLLPVGVVGFLYLVNPAFMGPMFTDPCGLIMLGIAGAGIVGGYFAIQKITDIEV